MRRGWYYLILFLLLAGCRGLDRLARFDGQDFRFIQREGSAEVFQSADGRNLRIERDDRGAKITVDGLVYQVTGSQGQLDVTFPDGRELTWTVQGSSSMGSSGMGVAASMEDWDRVEDLHSLVFGRASGESMAGSFARVAFGLVLLVFGALEIFNPRLAWQIAEGWRYENLEPSEVLLIFSRIGGVVLVGVGLLLVFGILA